MLKGYASKWQEIPGTGTGLMTIVLEAGHVIDIPFEVGGDLEAPPPGFRDDVRLTVELTREPDTRGGG